MRKGRWTPKCGGHWWPWRRGWQGTVALCLTAILRSKKWDGEGSRLRMGGLTEETAQKSFGLTSGSSPLFIKPFTDAVRKGFHRIRAWQYECLQQESSTIYGGCWKGHVYHESGWIFDFYKIITRYWTLWSVPRGWNPFHTFSISSKRQTRGCCHFDWKVLLTWWRLFVGCTWELFHFFS